MIYRNPKLLALAKEAPHCMWCKAPNYGQVVAAHSNRQKHGKGVAIKAHDIPAYICHECHGEIDGRTNVMGMDRQAKQMAWADAMFESLLWLLQSGRLVNGKGA